MTTPERSAHCRRHPWVLAAALVLSAGVAAGPSGAETAPPTLPMSPAQGTSRTTFVLNVPNNVVRRAGKLTLRLDADEPKGSSRSRCALYALPVPTYKGKGRTRTARFVMRAADIGFPDAPKPASGWCRGTYKVKLYTEAIIDDNDQTGAGGSLGERVIARSSIHVR